MKATLDDLKILKEPSEYQKQQISKYFRNLGISYINRRKKSKKTYFVGGCVFMVLSLIYFFGGHLFLGVLTLLISFACYKYSKKKVPTDFSDAFYGFMNGEYLICEGFAKKISPIDQVRFYGVVFESTDHIVIDEQLQVPGPGLKKNSPLILLYPTTSRTKDFPIEIFSEWSLSDEGIKHMTGLDELI